MAAITELDLTAVNDEAGSPVFTYDAGTNDVKLSLKALLGVSSLSGLDEEVFVKSVWQLLKLGQLAQITANDGAADGEALGAISSTGAGQFDTTIQAVPLAITVRVNMTSTPTSISGQTE